jgi:hypothetical protein
MLGMALARTDVNLDAVENDLAFHDDFFAFFREQSRRGCCLTWLAYGNVCKMIRSASEFKTEG